MTNQQMTSFSDFMLNKAPSDITEFLQFSAMISQNINKIWAEHIIETIYSIPDFESLLLPQEKETHKPITSETLEKWLKKMGRKKSYVGISLSFSNRAKTRKNAVLFADIILYIGEYQDSPYNLPNAENKKETALFGFGSKSNFRLIIQNPSLAGDICNRIKTRLEQLLAQP